MTTDTKICRRCGEPIPAGALGGNCPRCLIVLARTTTTGGASVATNQATAGGASVLASRGSLAPPVVVVRASTIRQRGQLPPNAPAGMGSPHRRQVFVSVVTRDRDLLSTSCQILTANSDSDWPIPGAARAGPKAGYLCQGSRPPGFDYRH